MSNWWLKSCPKCRGDLTEERSLGRERDIMCLQCGYMLRPQELAVLRMVPATARVPRQAIRRSGPLTRAA